MILIFEPTPFARSKSLANGVGLFYKDKFHIFTLLMSLTIYDIMSIFHFSIGVLGDEPYVYRIVLPQTAKLFNISLDLSNIVWYNPTLPPKKPSNPYKTRV